MCFQLKWLNKGFTEISVFCLLFGWVAHLLDGSLGICFFLLWFWKWVISKLLMRSSYTQKEKVFPSILLSGHLSDSDGVTPHFSLWWWRTWTGTLFLWWDFKKPKKAGELTNRNVPPSLIFIVLTITSVFVLPCLKAVSCGLHLV